MPLAAHVPARCAVMELAFDRARHPRGHGAGSGRRRGLRGRRRPRAYGRARTRAERGARVIDLSDAFRLHATRRNGAVYGLTRALSRRAARVATLDREPRLLSHGHAARAASARAVRRGHRAARRRCEERRQRRRPLARDRESLRRSRGRRARVRARRATATKPEIVQELEAAGIDGAARLHAARRSDRARHARRLRTRSSNAAAGCDDALHAAFAREYDGNPFVRVLARRIALRACPGSPTPTTPKSTFRAVGNVVRDRSPPSTTSAKAPQAKRCKTSTSCSATPRSLLSMIAPPGSEHGHHHLPHLPKARRS
jgi:hypothetical protein